MFRFIADVGDMCHGKAPGEAATREKAMRLPGYTTYVDFVDPVMYASIKGNPRDLIRLLQQIRSSSRKAGRNTASAKPTLSSMAAWAWDLMGMQWTCDSSVQKHIKAK